MIGKPGLKPVAAYEEIEIGGSRKKRAHVNVEDPLLVLLVRRARQHVQLDAPRLELAPHALELADLGGPDLYIDTHAD